MTETEDIVVSQNGHRLEQIQKDVGTLPAIIVSTSSVRVEGAGCGSHSLRGTYPYSMKGWTPMPDGQGPLTGFSPVTFTGAMEFDGNGKVMYSGTVSLNGAVFPRTNQQGSYQIGPDCKASMTLPVPNSSDSHLEVFVDKSGGAAYLVKTDADPYSGFPLFILAGLLEPDSSK